MVVVVSVVAKVTILFIGRIAAARVKVEGSDGLRGVRAVSSGYKVIEAAEG